MSSCVTTSHCENTCAHEVFHSSKRTKFCTAPWWMPATSVVSGGQHLNSLARCTWMLWEPTLWLEMTCISQMCNIVQQWKIFKTENMECHAILCVSSYVLTICVSSQQTFVFFLSKSWQDDPSSKKTSSITTWWFHIFSILSPTWGDDPFWLYFNWFETAKDVVVYGAAISACEQDGSWVEALQLMDSTLVS